MRGSIRNAASVLAAMLLTLIPVAAFPQSQPYTTYTEGDGWQQWDGALWQLTVNVSANNGSNDLAPAGTDFVIDIYGSDGSFINECENSLSVDGKGYCEFEPYPPFVTVDIYYLGGDGYAPSSEENLILPN